MIVHHYHKQISLQSVTPLFPLTAAVLLSDRINELLILHKLKSTQTSSLIQIQAKLELGYMQGG